MIGVALGLFVTERLSLATQMTFSSFVAYITHYLVASARYLIHGTIELGAYFVGGLAGAIISVALTKHDLGVKKMDNILRDSTDLLIIAILLLVIGAVVESMIISVFPLQ